jgi:hypothetical protein
VTCPSRIFFSSSATASHTHLGWASRMVLTLDLISAGLAGSTFFRVSRSACTPMRMNSSRSSRVLTEIPSASWPATRVPIPKVTTPWVRRTRSRNWPSRTHRVA